MRGTYYFTGVPYGLIREGITVNAIAPALIVTDMVSEATRARTGLIPVGRIGIVDEVAKVALMLTENGYMTGQTDDQYRRRPLFQRNCEKMKMTASCISFMIE